MKMRTNINFLVDLLSGCKNSNKMLTEAVSLEKMANVKSWLLPQTEEQHNHSNPHIFRFYRNIDGHAEMKYKHWTNDSWEPSGNQPGLKLLKVNVKLYIQVIMIVAAHDNITEVKHHCSH